MCRKGGSSSYALRTTRRKCEASDRIPGSPSPLTLKPSRPTSCSCVARQPWRSSMASRTSTSRLRTGMFLEKSGMGSTRRFAAYTLESRESASRPNGQSLSTSRRRFPKPLRSCWLSASSCVFSRLLTGTLLMDWVGQSDFQSPAAVQEQGSNAAIKVWNGKIVELVYDSEIIETTENPDLYSQT